MAWDRVLQFYNQGGTHWDPRAPGSGSRPALMTGSRCSESAARCHVSGESAMLAAFSSSHSSVVLGFEAGRVRRERRQLLFTVMLHFQFKPFSL